MEEDFFEEIKLSGSRRTGNMKLRRPFGSFPQRFFFGEIFQEEGENEGNSKKNKSSSFLNDYLPEIQAKTEVKIENVAQVFI